jgi:ribosomal protein L40E
MLLVVGATAPVLRHRVFEQPSFPNAASFPGQPHLRFPGSQPGSQPAPYPGAMFPPFFPFQPFPQERIISASLLTSPQAAQKGLAILLLLVAGATVFLLLSLRFERLYLIAGAASVLILLLLVQTAYDVVAREDLSWNSVLPRYYGHNGGPIVVWGWLPLLLAPVGLWLAVRWSELPSEDERQNLLARTPQPKKTPPASTQQAPVQTPSDVGLCAQCNAKNSLRATRCHACGATLPWETARLEKARGKASSAARRQSQAVARGQDFSPLLKTGLANLLTFVLCFCAPFIGYFIWRYLDNEDSPYSGAAFFGWVIGAVLAVGGILVRIIATMARVGSM